MLGGPCTLGLETHALICGFSSKDKEGDNPRELRRQPFLPSSSFANFRGRTLKRGTDRHVSGVRRPAAINPIWEKGRREREGTTYVEILQIQWPSGNSPNPHH